VLLSALMIAKTRRAGIASSGLRVLPVALISVLGLLLTGCSGSKPSRAVTAPAAKASASSSPAAGSPLPAGSQPASGADAAASAKADWTTFFNPDTPVAQRVKLLQDGTKFESYLRVQARPGVAHLTTEQVTTVTINGALAIVTYNILIDGRTGSALSDQSGMADFSAGTWQVSDTDFCSLLTLENKGKSVPGCS
jgi:hypothetical protein